MNRKLGLFFSIPPLVNLTKVFLEVEILLMVGFVLFVKYYTPQFGVVFGAYTWTILILGSWKIKNVLLESKIEDSAYAAFFKALGFLILVFFGLIFSSSNQIALLAS